MDFRALSDAVINTINNAMGESIVYTPAVGASVSITAIFDNAYVEVQGVMSMKPILRIRLADLVESPDRGDQVTINSVDYKVMESREDGYGGSTLILQKL